MPPPSIARQIWALLKDRQGFGLDGLEHDDPKVFHEILGEIQKLVDQEMLIRYRDLQAQCDRLSDIVGYVVDAMET